MERIGYASGGSVSSQQATSQQASTSFIPDYAESPILREIAQYARGMAPQVYQWGMEQFTKNQGNIDAMMRNALSYASPQRIASEMGMAEAGVQQGAEAGRQSALRDLESYGIDPSSGRYAALDTANRVMSGAAAAGAGNQQRMATEAAGTAQQQQALSAGLQNVQTGYGASNAMNQLLGTAMSLKYPPLGQTSTGSSSSSGESTSWSGGGGGGGSASGGNVGGSNLHGSYYTPAGAGGGSLHVYDEGGYVPPEGSPSDGARTDDVKANLTAGEFVIPKDVVEFKGKEFFYKLMAQARKLRATAGSNSGDMATGYGAA